MKGGYVLNWLIKVAQCLKNGFPIYQDAVGGIRSTGHRGAGWRSFSGGEGNDTAIVKRIFIRETWRNQRQDKKRKRD